MDIPAIDLIRTSSNSTNNDYRLTDALELYLRLKGTDKDKTFIRTANRNTEYVIQVWVISQLLLIPHLKPLNSEIG